MTELILLLHILELDALGDELAYDQDAAYLDDAINAPAAPDTVPAEKDTSGSRTKVYNSIPGSFANFPHKEFQFNIGVVHLEKVSLAFPLPSEAKITDSQDLALCIYAIAEVFTLEKIFLASQELS